MVYKSGQIFLPFCHNSRVWRTDGQTDRRTDGRTDRILITIPRLHYMQRGKKRIEIDVEFVYLQYLMLIFVVSSFIMFKLSLPSLIVVARLVRFLAWRSSVSHHRCTMLMQVTSSSSYTSRQAATQSTSSRSVHDTNAGKLTLSGGARRYSHWHWRGKNSNLTSPQTKMTACSR